jgi:hypothetical protein
MRIFLCVLGVYLGAGIAAWAQNIGGSIAGQVLDAQGLAVEDARILVRDEGGAWNREAMTDRLGRFWVPSVPQGLYRLEAAKVGFQTATTEGVRVAIGDSPSVKLVLVPAATGQTVTVTAEVTALRTDTPERGSSYNAAMMNDLPMLGGGTGRNFRTQAYLTPGVALSTGAHRPFAV